MSIANATAQWWIRIGVSDKTGGGGFDDGISGFGTNYANQDSPQLTRTDLATTGAGVKIITSATGGFTAAMIGNAIQLTSGTNADPGFYWIDGHTDTNTITVTEAPDNGGALSGGNGKVGGALEGPEDFDQTGTAVGMSPTIPIQPGNIINVEGAGTDDPSATDYEWTGWIIHPDGDDVDGFVTWLGYNGRPHLRRSNGGLLFFNMPHNKYEHLKVSAGSATNGNLGLLNLGISEDCFFDQNGFDVQGMLGGSIDCKFTNTGSSTAGIEYAIVASRQNYHIWGNTIDSWKGGGIEVTGSIVCAVIDNLIFDCKGTTPTGIRVAATTSEFGILIIGNVIDGHLTTAIEFTHQGSISTAYIANNILTNNSGWGIKFSDGTLAVNDRRVHFCDYNFFKSNSSGELDKKTKGINSVSVTSNLYPRSGDYNLNNVSDGGALVRVAGFPSAFPDGTNISYEDGGALQHQDATPFFVRGSNSLIGR